MPDATRLPYSPRPSGDGKPVPNATLKVPTGGGKTFLACAALSRFLDATSKATPASCFGSCPTKRSTRRDLRALGDREHAYRQTLDRASAYRTIILEKTDTLRRADVVADLARWIDMLQSTNRENQDSLRLFRDRGDVHGLYARRR